MISGQSWECESAALGGGRTRRIMEHSPLRVLVVDDDQHMQSAVVATAEQLVGMDVVTASSTTEAFTRLDQVDVDCIVCDYEMPGMNGIDFLTAVRSRFGDVPFILFTGQGDERVAAAALRAGATDYVTKEDGWPAASRTSASSTATRRSPMGGSDRWSSPSSPTGSTWSTSRVVS